MKSLRLFIAGIPAVWVIASCVFVLCISPALSVHTGADYPFYRDLLLMGLFLGVAAILLYPVLVFYSHRKMRAGMGENLLYVVAGSIFILSLSIDPLHLLQWLFG